MGKTHKHVRKQFLSKLQKNEYKNETALKVLRLSLYFLNFFFKKRRKKSLESVDRLDVWLVNHRINKTYVFFFKQKSYLQVRKEKVRRRIKKKINLTHTFEYTINNLSTTPTTNTFFSCLTPIMLIQTITFHLISGETKFMRCTSFAGTHMCKRVNAIEIIINGQKGEKHM